MHHFLTLLAEPTSGCGDTNVGTIIMIAVLLVAFVGLIWFSSYSQKKKQKQAAEMNSALKVGDQVKTIGGIVGVIVGVDENNGNFEIQTGTSTMVLDRNAVYPITYFDAQNGKPAAKSAPIEEGAGEGIEENPEKPAEELAPEGKDAGEKAEDKAGDKSDKEE